MVDVGIFTSPTKGRITTGQMVEELVDFTKKETDYLYKLVIGTDSKTGRPNGSKPVNFITAIVIHRIGKGARYFWQKKTAYKIGSLRDKIYTETLFSIQMAEKIVPEFTNRLNGQRCNVEIHIDVGNQGPTREMIKEVVGMVTGNGFNAKTKPESFGASYVADRHT